MPNTNLENHLLCFAHEGEAQVFLEQDTWLQLKQFSPLKVFEKKTKGNVTHLPRNLLLITGEGLWKSYDALTTVLSTLNLDREASAWRIFNMGLAAGLTSEVEIGKVYSIDLVLSEARQGSSYQTYTSEIACLNTFPHWPLISLQDRLLPERESDRQLAKELSAFAPLADREAWSLARAAKIHGLSFSVLKVVSDLPFQVDTATCQLVQERASEFSLLLWQAYQQIEIAKSSQYPMAKTISVPSVELAPPLGFYFTHELRRQWNRLLQQYQVFTSADYDLFLQRHSTILQELSDPKSALSPKKKTLALLEKLERILFPERELYRQKLQQLALPLQLLKERGLAQYHWSQEKEGQLELQLKLSEHKDQLAVQLALESLDWKQIKDFFDGKLAQFPFVPEDSDHV
jgi:hypothetical protein